MLKKIVDYLHKYCPHESGLMIFRRIPETPGYEIRGLGDTKRTITEISGLQLVIEKTITIRFQYSYFIVFECFLF